MKEGSPNLLTTAGFDVCDNVKLQATALRKALSGVAFHRSMDRNFAQDVDILVVSTHGGFAISLHPISRATRHLLFFLQ